MLWGSSRDGECWRAWLCGSPQRKKSHLWVSKATGSLQPLTYLQMALGGRNVRQLFSKLCSRVHKSHKNSSPERVKKSLRKESKVTPPGKITRHRCLPRPWEGKKLAVARIPKCIFSERRSPSLGHPLALSLVMEKAQSPGLGISLQGGFLTISGKFRPHARSWVSRSGPCRTLQGQKLTISEDLLWL